MPFPVDSVITVLSGGAGTVGLVYLALYISGRQPTPAERKILLAEIEKRDIIIKDLTTELHGQNEAVRRDVVPVLSQVVQALPFLRKNNG